MKRIPPIVAMIVRTLPPEPELDLGGVGVGFIGSDLSPSIMITFHINMIFYILNILK
jgi:hypothetical protein